MKHKQFLLSAVSGVAVIFVLVLALRSLDQFFPGLDSQLESFVASYGLFGVFAGVFFGSTLFPFPTDAFFVSTVSLSRNAFEVTAVAILAAFVATLANYALARWLSKSVVEKWAGKQKLAEAAKWMDSYGPAAILLFGVLPVSPFFDTMTFVAGLAKMDLKKFALFSLVSRIIHYGGLALFAAKLLG